MRHFDIIGLEMHSRSMWYHAHVKRVLNFMEDNGFNCLIFHQSDLTNRLVYPSKYLNSRMMWEKFRGQRSFEIENIRLYLINIIEEAAKKNIDVYFNLKEIFYTDEIIELFPNLVQQKGIACPTDPFWMEYMEACFEDLCMTVPGFKGIILSNGTHEARTTITKRNCCECERCKSTSPFNWYYESFKAISAPLKRYEKEFAVRDFSFTRENQNLILDAAKAADDHVVISLKNTPHDYFITFPNNPKIGTTGQREWAEFDTWGQFYAGGIFPASVAEDMKKRLDFCHSKGVKGVFFRTDWEGMIENSTLSSPNMINLYAAGLLSNNVDADLDIAYKKWGQAGWIETLKCDSDDPSPIPPSNPEAWKYMKNFMTASWNVLRKTVYVKTHWFCEDNMFPDSLDKAFKMLIVIHGRDEWDPGASKLVRITKENIEAIIFEKEEALHECQKLRSILRPEMLGLPKETLEDIEEMLKLYEIYCRIGLHSCKVVFLTQYALDNGLAVGPKTAAEKAVADLRVYREEVIKFFAKRTKFYHHIIFWLLNENRMKLLADDASGLLDGSVGQVINTFRKG